MRGFGTFGESPNHSIAWVGRDLKSESPLHRKRHLPLDEMEGHKCFLQQHQRSSHRFLLIHNEEQEREQMEHNTAWIKQALPARLRYSKKEVTLFYQITNAAGKKTRAFKYYISHSSSQDTSTSASIKRKGWECS